MRALLFTIASASLLHTLKTSLYNGSTLAACHPCIPCTLRLSYWTRCEGVRIRQACSTKQWLPYTSSFCPLRIARESCSRQKACMSWNGKGKNCERGRIASICTLKASTFCVRYTLPNEWTVSTPCGADCGKTARKCHGAPPS